MASRFLDDRVKEMTATTGTGNITLAGAASGFVSFNTAFSTTKNFFYVIDGGSEWEYGLGHLSGSTTLVRDTVLGSSNSGSLVTFSAGTKNVYCDVPSFILGGYNTTATAAGTTTLTVASSPLQFFTGSTTQTVVMPVSTTLALGLKYQITNLSTGVVTVQSSGGNTIQAMASGSTLYLVCIAVTGTGTAVWSTVYCIAGSSAAINALTGAGATNSIDNAGYAQSWSWNTLAGANGLSLTSTSTAAASNAQALFNVALSGANSNSNQTTYAAKASNTHTGTGSINIGGYFTASGGATNYAAMFDSGLVVMRNAGGTIEFEIRHSETGMYNTFIGRAAGQLALNQAGIFSAGISYCSANTIVGNGAGAALAYGNENTIVGANAGDVLTATVTDNPNIVAALNTLIGSNAGANLTTAGNSVFIGQKAGLKFTTGSGNVFIGKSVGAGTGVGTGQNNTWINAGRAAAVGDSNVLIGYGSGDSLTGNYNVVIGDTAATAVSADSGVFIGRAAGNSTTSATNCTFVGAYAGYDQVSGYYNTFIGMYSGQHSTGNENTCLGVNSGQNASGNNGLFVGALAGQNLTSGNQNTMVGDNAGVGASGSTAAQNTVVGQGAGFALASSGNGNILIGFQAGDAITSGARNLIIGYNLDAPSNTASDQVLIGNLIGGVGNSATQKLGFFATKAASPVIQQTTSITGASFTANSGTAVNDASTFGGYTIKQIVAALQAYGLLA